MIPVEQNKFHPVGNCLDACLASIFEVPLESLPHHHGDDWWDVYNAWLAERGYRMDVRSPDEPAPEGYHLAAVRSPRGPWLHSVVVKDGEVVWDPSPDRHMGVGETVRWDVLEPVEKK